MELNIDKTGWKSYRFDEFAQNISQRVEPKQTDLEIYVGLEHLDPDSLHIKRNGTPADVEGTKLKFYKGDVIFGKRRAYQRKAALAETDGICSAHAMVLRANTKLIDERLFPFFFHSKVFQDIAVKISVGGLSPTINWKDLAKQEFLLPPKDQQTRLAELLWAADEVVEREREVKERLEQLKLANLDGLLNGKNIDESEKQLWIKYKVSDLGVISTSSVDKKSNPDEEEVNLVNYMDVYGNKTHKITSNTNFMKVTATKTQLEKNQVEKGDVLFTPSSETNDDIGHSVVVYEKLAKTLYSYHLVRLRFNIEIDLDFKRYLFNNPSVMAYFAKRSKGVTRMTLGIDDFNNLTVLVPPLDLQKSIAQQLSEIDLTIINLVSQLSTSIKLKQALINEIF